MNSLPGMTICVKSPSDTCRALKPNWLPLTSKKIIVIATATITDDNLFANGLFQNIYILYKLYDSMGYVPILLINERPTDINKVPLIMRHVRMLTIDEINRNPIPIHIYLEVGMSVDESLRRVFRMTGTRIVKLYLGNILNIDIETPMFYNGMHFSHHVVGELDEIWVSPHYKQHDEYAAILNHVNPDSKSMKIAPYVWDPCILTLNGTRTFKWRSRKSGEKETIIILEPNISFQKSALIPLLIADRNYKDNKRDLQVLIGNGERLLMNPFFTNTILPYLELYKDNKLIFGKRHTIAEIMNDYPHAYAICNQWNNEYNYMTLEYLHAGFPIIHNASDWSDAGYYYKCNSITDGASALLRAQTHHSSSLETYMSGAEVIRWRHSIYNPDLQRAWEKVLDHS